MVDAWRPSRWTLHDLRLHLVTDAMLCGERDLLYVVDAAVRGGATCVQLREKKLSTRLFVERARALKMRLAPLNVPLIINDRLDVALVIEADGLHIGQDDLSAEDARRWLPNGIIGLSIESTGQLGDAMDAPVDYFGVSPVFATSSKSDAAPPLGLEGLRALRAMTHRPLIGIGGIGPDNVSQVRAAGADGVAVISAVLSASDPAQAARLLRTALSDKHE
jgi:thiamine-phosphate pyrophosphorylase